MKNLLNTIDNLIVSNKIAEAINIILLEINDFQKHCDDKSFEVNEIKNQLLIISAILNDLKSQSLSNTINIESYYLYKSKQVLSILEIKNNIENHIEFSKHLRNKELAEIEKDKFKTFFEDGINKNSHKPVLYMSESPKQDSVEELPSFLKVASLIEPGDAIKRVSKLVIDTSIFKQIESNSHTIDRLLKEENFYELPKLKNCEEIIMSFNDYNKSIEKIIQSIKSHPKNVNLQYRAVQPHFYLVNEGGKSLINPLISVVENEHIKFVDKTGLSAIDISLPVDRPDYIKRNIDFLKNIDFYVSETHNNEKQPNIKSKILQQYHPGIGDNVYGDKITFYNREKAYLKKYEMKKFENELRIDYSGSIKKGFFSSIENEDFYLLPYLQKGEEIFLEYRCYLDNCEDHFSGKIRVIGI